MFSYVWLTLEIRLVASGREYEMNASRERERERRRAGEREGGQVEGTGPGRDVSRCKPGDDVERREPRRARDSRIVPLEVSDLVPTDRHYSRVRCVAAHGPRSRADGRSRRRHVSR